MLVVVVLIRRMVIIILVRHMDVSSWYDVCLSSSWYDVYLCEDDLGKQNIFVRMIWVSKIYSINDNKSNQ